MPCRGEPSRASDSPSLPLALASGLNTHLDGYMTCSLLTGLIPPASIPLSLQPSAKAMAKREDHALSFQPCRWPGVAFSCHPPSGQSSQWAEWAAVVVLSALPTLHARDSANPPLPFPMAADQKTFRCSTWKWG